MDLVATLDPPCRERPLVPAETGHKPLPYPRGYFPPLGKQGWGVVNTIIPPIPLPLFLTFFVLSFNLQAFMGVNILGVLNIFPVEV